jgi:acetyl-CoA carboxylase biotin carboxyl carrier protein
MPKKLKQGAAPGLMVGGVNLSEVERLLAFMQSHGLEEFEYQDGDVRIRLKKALGQPAFISGPAPVVHHVAPAPSAPPAAPPPAAAATAAAPTPAPAAAHVAPAEDLHVVKSPIVGTFYSSPSPEAPPFVAVGARVESGQVLCIIEAMKLMNEIESDAAGTVARVFVENGQPVEYSEPLFGIKKK